MSEVRVKSWPLAVVGSMLVHVSALTGVYLAPDLGLGSAPAKAGLGSGVEVETTPLYLMPDELPPDVAARLAADQAAAAKNKPLVPPPETEKPPEPKVAVKPPPPPMPPIPVELGTVDGPKIITEAWLKNDSPDEHSAPESKVTQPQQDMNAVPAPQGMPGAGGADGQGKPTPKSEQPDTKPQNELGKPTPTGPSAPASAPAATASTPPAPPVRDVPVEAAKPVSADAPTERAPVVEVKPLRDVPEGASKPEIKAGNSGGEAPKVTQAASEPRVSPVAATAPAPIPPKPEPVTAPTAGGQPGGPTEPVAVVKSDDRAPGASGSPMATKAVASDRDSDAASVKKAAVYKNGKVEVGEGLDIKTYRPTFGLMAQALLRPRSPTLEIVFGKDGRAKRVRVLRSSGYQAEIDEPVVTALYNWRAKGRVLDELPARSDSSVSLEITIILE